MAYVRLQPDKIQFEREVARGSPLYPPTARRGGRFGFGSSIYPPITSFPIWLAERAAVDFRSDLAVLEAARALAASEEITWEPRRPQKLGRGYAGRWRHDGHLTFLKPHKDVRGSQVSIHTWQS